MDVLAAIGNATLTMYLDAAPWLILGMVAAGLVHVLVPEGLLGRWLGGKGAGPIVKAAVIGAPLPLCSCGVLPAAVGLRREGASKGATVSFLIATPETGPDSVAVSYALLGPFMAVVRPVAAVLSAIFAGLLTALFARGDAAAPAPQTTATCCATSCGAPSPVAMSAPARVGAGLKYAFTDILDDIALWLLVGFVIAGGMSALIPPQALAEYGSGLGAMVVMLVVGVPVYVCATASTPIAVGLLAAGVSPGAALVFLLAGPATNVATLGVVAKDLGPRALAAYLGGIAVGAVTMGLATDALVSAFAIDVQVDMRSAAETVPDLLKGLAGVLLAPFFAGALYKEGRKRLA